MKGDIRLIEPLVPWLEEQTGYGLLDYTITQDRHIECTVTDGFTSYGLTQRLPDDFEVIRLPSHLWPMPEGADWNVDQEGNCDYLATDADFARLGMCLPPLLATQRNLATTFNELRSQIKT